MQRYSLPSCFKYCTEAQTSANGEGKGRIKGVEEENEEAYLQERKKKKLTGDMNVYVETP